MTLSDPIDPTLPIFGSTPDFESTWDEIDRCREREELTRAVAISRRQFEAGECQPEGEVFDEMEKMLDEMQSNGDCM